MAMFANMVGEEGKRAEKATEQKPVAETKESKKENKGSTPVKPAPAPSKKTVSAAPKNDEKKENNMDKIINVFESEKTRKTSLTVSIDDELNEKLRKIARHYGISVSSVVNTVLQDFVENYFQNA